MQTFLMALLIWKKILTIWKTVEPAGRLFRLSLMALVTIFLRQAHVCFADGCRSLAITRWITSYEDYFNFISSIDDFMILNVELFIKLISLLVYLSLTLLIFVRIFLLMLKINYMRFNRRDLYSFIVNIICYAVVLRKHDMI